MRFLCVFIILITSFNLQVLAETSKTNLPPHVHCTCLTNLTRAVMTCLICQQIVQWRVVVTTETVQVYLALTVLNFKRDELWTQHDSPVLYLLMKHAQQFVEAWWLLLQKVCPRSTEFATETELLWQKWRGPWRDWASCLYSPRIPVLILIDILYHKYQI